MRATGMGAVTLVVALMLVGCGDADGGGSGGGGGSGSGSGSGSDNGSSSSGGSPSDVPTSSAELFEYLKAGGYLGFAKESAVHKSTGPHGGNVLTFINPSLEASLSAGDAEHPPGAASVKELYLGGSSLEGWAVMVKTQPSSDGGQGWYWYEIYSATDPSSPVADGNGVPLCYTCHASGKDFFRSPFPLQ